MYSYVVVILLFSCIVFYLNLGHEITPLDEIVTLYDKGYYVKADQKWHILIRKKTKFLINQISILDRKQETFEAANLADLLIDLKPDDAKNITMAGKLWIKAGYLLKGKGLLQKAIKLDPEHIEARLTLAEIALDNENIANVERYLKGVIRPSSTRVIVVKARLLQLKGKLEEGRKKFAMAVELDPSNINARFFLVDSLIELGRYENALKLLDETDKLAPYDPALKLVRIKALLKSSHNTTNDLSLELLHLSTHKNKKISFKASSLLIDLLEKERRFTEALEQILVLIDVMNEDKGKTDIKKQKSTLLVRASELSMSIGEQYEQRKADEKAELAYTNSITFLQQALGESRSSQGTITLLSERYLELGTHYFSKAKKTDNKRLSRDFLGYAIFNLERAAELSPNKISHAHSILGEILNHLNRHSEAVVQFKKVRNELSGFVQSIYSYGESCLKVRNFIDALTAFKKVLSVEADNWKAHKGIGLTYWNLKNTKKAEFHFKKAQSLHKTDPVIWLYLGKIRESQKRYSDAKVCYRKVKNLTQKSQDPTEQKLEIVAKSKLQEIPMLIKAEKKLKSLGGKFKEDEL